LHSISNNAKRFKFFIMTTLKKYNTGNVSTKEYFTITEVGSLNAYVKLYDVSGFIADKVIPLKEFKNWI